MEVTQVSLQKPRAQRVPNQGFFSSCCKRQEYRDGPTLLRVIVSRAISHLRLAEEGVLTTYLKEFRCVVGNVLLDL